MHKNRCIDVINKVHEGKLEERKQIEMGTTIMLGVGLLREMTKDSSWDTLCSS